MGTEKNEIFKKGIWLKEQQGVLTVGSMDKKSTDIMVVPDELRSRLDAFESDMMEALYGEDRETFQPGILDIELLFRQIKKRFGDVQLNVSFDKSDEHPFVCDFDTIFSLLEKLVLSSISGSSNPVIYISASLVQDHLCIIYRDSESASSPSDLDPEFFLIKNRLGGDMEFKKADKKGTYYDLTIPSADG
ncbi:hypothetical protein [uncultured Desulfobacter sp.]|uniref:hypothetical protein n=1 Tax=uncultured Desulfobacter sp. TaxID=240139 RepID=UPI002AAC07C9|nr:hypothetical protein [uncultured Desulfobacter sp.]